MLELSGNTWDILIPNDDEWVRLVNGEYSEIRGIPVVSPKYMGMRGAVLERAYSTQTVITVLSTKFSLHRKWSPLMFLWRNGAPHERLFSGDLRPLDEAIRVNFHRVFCSACGLSFWGYVVNIDAYRSGELQATLSRLREYERCPRCDVAIRGPMLVEVLRVCEQDHP